MVIHLGETPLKIHTLNGAALVSIIAACDCGDFSRTHRDGLGIHSGWVWLEICTGLHLAPPSQSPENGIFTYRRIGRNPGILADHTIVLCRCQGSIDNGSPVWWSQGHGTRGQLRHGLVRLGERFGAGKSGRAGGHDGHKEEEEDIQYLRKHLWRFCGGVEYGKLR